MTTIDGWHFAGATLRDGRALPKKGETLRHAGDVVPCPDDDDLARGAGGLHACERAIDALGYAPGCMVARVRLSGTIVPHGDPVDKYAASERTTLTDYVDATKVLREFARRCALDAARRYAADALDAAGMADQATRLRALPDDATPEQIRVAARAARVASDASDASAASHAASYAASYASYAASYASDAASPASHASDASDASATSAAFFAARAARHAASDASYASYAASYASDAASHASYASYAAIYAASDEQNEMLAKMLDSLVWPC